MTPRTRTVAEVLSQALIVVLALSVARTFLLYATGADGHGRHHVEAATVWFVAAMALAIGTRRRPAAEAATPLGVLEQVPSSLIWLLFVAAAFALYFPALGIGFLSDDWSLVALAGHWRIGPVSATLFRPAPLAVWAAMANIGLGPAAFHALNIALHGTAAFLSVVILRGWRLPMPWPWIAGALAVASPVAVEPVAWASAIFDLSATCCILAAVLTRTPWRVVALLVVAMLCKETAFVGPLLVLVAAWARGGPVPRARVRALAIMAGIGIGYALMRAWLSDTHPEIDRYVLQRALFSDVGSRARPFHELFIAVHPRLTLIWGLSVIALLALASCVRSAPAMWRILGGGALWILVALAAVFPVMPINGDLQGSRYLYVGQLGWCAIIAGAGAALTATRITAVDLLGRAIAVLLLAGSATALWAHERSWVAAGQTRTAIVSAIDLELRSSPCAAIAVQDLPDTVGGAYLFRNGVSEVFAATIGARVVAAGAPAGCTFRWSETTGRVTRE